MIKKKYKATIYYTIDAQHPDIKYINNYDKNKIFNFTDVYKLPVDYTEDQCLNIIKSDLRLVAGGGYDSKHIHNIKFNIEKMED